MDLQTSMFWSCESQVKLHKSRLLIHGVNSALTLENLETKFYQEGFAKFPDSDFAALGLQQADIINLKSIGGTEATHVSTLTSAIAGSGAAPVQPCKYKFGFTTAAKMVETASVLENVGVSASVNFLGVVLKSNMP